MDEWMEGWIDVCEWVVGWVREVDGYIVEAWMDKWMEGWTHG